MPQRKKILFLYFELAGYFLACVNKLIELYDVDVYIVRYPVNAVAPFNFKANECIRFYEYNKFTAITLIEFVKQLEPDLLYTSGWSNKNYVAASKSIQKKIPVVLTFDNPWLGTWKQYIASLIGPFYLPRIFTHCWVPGEPNARYARKLGFHGSQLLQGMYSADYDLFHNYYLQFKDKKQQHFPKRFIYVGRYVELKGLRELWAAFIRLQDESPNDWELWCLGKGDLDTVFPSHEKIKNFGFVQPDKMNKFIEQTGVFILPAYYEHWGVVVHEFAAAGFPLLCTSTTSAATRFLKNKYNGFELKPKNTESILSAFRKIIALNDTELSIMAANSASLSAKITPDTWSKTLMSLVK